MSNPTKMNKYETVAHKIATEFSKYENYSVNELHQEFKIDKAHLRTIFNTIKVSAKVFKD